MKPNSSSRVLSSRTASFAFVLFAMSAPQAFAQTWSGTTNGNWNTIANWGGVAVPTTGTAINFIGSANPVTNNDITSLTTGNITFGAATAASFTLAGNDIVLGGNLTTGAPSSGGPFTHLININMQLNGDRTFNAANNNNLTLNGAITQDATPRNVTRGTGGGTINWNGANTFTGTLTLSGGGGNVFNSIADTGSSAIGIGSGNIIMSAANNQFTFNGAASGATARNITLGTAGTGVTAATFSNNSATANTLTLSGTVTSGAADKVFGLAGSNTGANLVSGVISNPVTNTLSLRKSGSGVWNVSGANTFTGTIAIQEGTLAVGTIGSVGSASSNLGAQATAPQATINMGNGTNTSSLSYTGATGETTNRIFNFAGSNHTANINHNGLGTLRITSNTTATVDGTKTLSLGGSGTTGGKRGEFVGAISNSATGVTSVTKSDTSRWALQGANTFTGNVTINNGFLEVASIGNTGSVTSNLGAGTTIAFGNGTATGILEYVGGGETTNRIVDLRSANTGGGAILNNGAGALTFTANTAHTGTVNDKTLTLGGTTTGFTNEFNGVINNQTGGLLVGLTKTDASTWSLGGANTYTGATAVSAGVLAVNGSLANTTTTVAGTLQGSGTIGGSVAIQSGGTLAPGNSIESLGVASVDFLVGSTYAYELNSAVLNGDLTYSTGTLDIASGVGPLGTTLTLTELFAGTLAVNDKLTLISYTGGWTSGELFNYLGSTLADDSTITLGANQWLFNYDDTTGGSNFSGDQTGAASFVTITVIPEPNVAALLGGLGMIALLRRRRED